jgi:hypothetical protein
VRGPRAFSSHMPVLMEAVQRTTGAIVELGAGWFSTPLLHWMCSRTERPLVSVETSPDFYRRLETFRESWHDVRFVNTWDEAQLEQPWGVAFIDHAPVSRRKEDIKRLANWAEVIVAHDTCDKRYQYGEVWPLFRWSYQHQVRPKTTIGSNFMDVAAWF